ncbi:disulfide isomerase/thiol-disulfide oxidase [Agrobacterium tumefaciens]|nr:disulfide isomerase/thiol-disulfide oxidase [Agrobacterium tumefaciens]
MINVNYRRHACISALLITLVASPVTAVPSQAQEVSKELPPILKSIELQGLKILGEMDVPGGLRAFAAKAGSQPLAIYLTRITSTWSSARLWMPMARIWLPHS